MGLATSSSAVSNFLSSIKQEIPQKSSKILEEAFNSTDNNYSTFKIRICCPRLPDSWRCFFLFLFSTQACPNFLIRLQTSKGETVFCSFLHYNSVELCRVLTELMWTQSCSQREYSLNSTDDSAYIRSI